MCWPSTTWFTEHAWQTCLIAPVWKWSRRNSFTHLLLLQAGMAVLLNVGYVIDNIVPPYKGEKHVNFLVILAVARMVICVTRNKGLYEGANFSHRDLILYFRHQLRVKIRCDRKCLGCITFDKRWGYAANLVI